MHIPTAVINFKACKSLPCFCNKKKQ